MQAAPLGRSGHVSTVQVTVPEELAGTIIGKRGANIRNVRMDSGAEVEVHDLVRGDQDRVIEIRGTSTQIQLAQRMLQEWYGSGLLG